jgi:hypothetical protein
MLAQGRTIQRHKRPFLPWAVLVNRLGHELLARARLALDQHRGIRWRDPLQPVHHVLHLRAIADHALKAKPFVESPMELGIRTPQILATSRILDHRPQLLQIERLQ